MASGWSHRRNLCRHGLRGKMNVWFLYEIVQRQHSRERRRQRRRNRRIASIRPVLFFIDDIFVNRGVERFLHLAGRPGELKHCTPFG